MVRTLIAEAKAGRSVYITDMHARFRGLADDESDQLSCVVEMLDGTGLRRFDLRVPRLEGLDGEARAFVEAYIHAEVYNIISALGGRRMTVHFDQTRAALAAILTRLPLVFGIELPRSERSGYGRAVNVTDRMIAAISPGAPSFSFELAPLERTPAAPRPRPSAVDLVSFFRGRTQRLEGRALVGLDVGGTDIKAVLVDDGKVVNTVEYDWFPASFLRSRQLVDPICLIVRLLVARLWVHRLPGGDGRRAALIELAANALHEAAGTAGMARALAGLEKAGLDRGLRCDGIGLCFPDVVVRNKIVGGEVYKTRGIRNNPAIDYEKDFAELTDLDLRLREWVAPGGAVRIINDGPMASFTAAVEMAALPDATADATTGARGFAGGVFAHTLGTELGTGWVTETGAIPDIPLEVYNFIIDLGCWPERAFEPDDLRSVNNFNTGLPGTLQKYCSQSGVFRLALKRFPLERPDLFRELEERRFIQRRAAGGTEGGTEGWYVPTEPVDQRKPFLEHMMRLPDRERDDTNRDIWREIGKSLAVTLLETRRILEPGTDVRFLFGRLVKNATCFDLIVEGARSIDPGISLVVAGTGLANSALMRQLERLPEVTVAQFAQAVGAVYFVNE